MISALPYLRYLTGVSLLALMLLALGCVELGRRLGRRRVARHGVEALEGFGAIESAVFALLGLLLAFTFAAAASRFDARRDLIVREANAIGTAYLRLDTLPRVPAARLRRLFGEYVDARLAVYARIHEAQRPRAELARVSDLQDQIWKEAVSGCRQSGVPETMLLVLPALNEMIDVTSIRTIALRTHVPALIVALLVVLVLGSSLLAGFGMAHVETRSWAHMVAFVAILAVTVFVIFDYEFPRFGLIRIDWADQLLLDLRKQMP